MPRVSLMSGSPPRCPSPVLYVDLGEVADLARRGAFILFVMGHISYESSTKPLCPHLHLACIYLMLSSCVVATTSGPRLASRVAMNTEPPPSQSSVRKTAIASADEAMHERHGLRHGPLGL